MVLATPTPGSFCPMAYSPATSTIVLANTSSNPAFLQDTVSTFQWNGSTWVLQNSGLANNPFLRSETSMAYDTTGTQLVLFGGRGLPGTEFRNDLWGYSASSVWSQLEPNYNDIGLSIGTISTSLDTATYPYTVVQSNITGTVGLCIRARSYMFALSSGVLLYGGFDERYTFQDNYLWASGSWSTLTPTNTPPIRVGACSASNGTTQAVLAFGANGSEMLNDVWVYASSNWTQITTNNGPSVRKDAVMAYYPTGGYYLLFSGQDTSGHCLTDTWSLTISGTTGTWANLAPANNPSGRIGASMAFDTSSSQMILFGGQDNWNLNNQTWNWSGSNWIKLAGTY